jgi:3-oxoadipate enol-lactonase
VDLLKQEDLRPELGAIRAPALVLKGPLDRYTPVAWSKEIAALIPGARYVEIAGTGHCSHISMPEVFNRTLLGWLSEIDKQRGPAEDKA